jgi:YNFM family putative membrane transporter
VLTDLADWRAGMGAVGATGLASAGLLILALPESRRFAARAPNLPALWTSLIGHFADPGLRLLFLTAFLAMGGFVCVYNCMGFRLLAPPFLLSQTTIGLVFILYLVGMVASPAMGDLAGRFGRRKVLWIAAAMMLAGAAATLPDNLLSILFGVALITAGFFGAHSIALDCAPKTPRRKLPRFLVAALSGGALAVAPRLARVPPPRHLAKN